MSQLSKQGYQIIPDLYTDSEIDQVLRYITLHIPQEQFGLREFISIHAELKPVLFNAKLKALIESISKTAKPIKSIYFDKPPNANWIVNWHQDLTINVKGKAELPGFKNWRVLKGRTVVQPPRAFLENIFTIRIHLDDCSKENGALRIIEGSHQDGVMEVKNGISELLEKEVVCEVPKGGVLLMKPLALHASKRTENKENRRVIHIEFTDQKLPEPLEWNEAF